MAPPRAAITRPAIQLLLLLSLVTAVQSQFLVNTAAIFHRLQSNPFCINRYYQCVVCGENWQWLSYCGFDASPYACWPGVWPCQRPQAVVPSFSVAPNCGKVGYNTFSDVFPTQVRWGSPADNTIGESGFGFSPVIAQPTSPNRPTHIGTAVHFNWPIWDGTAANSFSIIITVAIFDAATGGELARGNFGFDMQVDETLNECEGRGCPWVDPSPFFTSDTNPRCIPAVNGGYACRMFRIDGVGPLCCPYATEFNNPCADKIYPTNQFDLAAPPFVINGRAYTLRLDGFSSPDDPSRVAPYFISNERKNTVVYLFASVVCLPCANPNHVSSPECDCVCPNACPGGQIQDYGSCACSCPAVECAYPKYQDPTSCGCVCPVWGCPAPQFQDPNTCGCVCPAVACPAPQYQDPTSCGCVCPAVSCPPPQFQDPNSCACVCPAWGCPTPKYQDPNTCGCVCPAVTCPPNHIQDPTTCDCVCPAVTCPPNQYQEQATCGCVCPAPNCNPAKLYDYYTCQCYCPPGTPTCSPPQILSDDCRCVCPAETLAPCVPPQIWDDPTCQCTCPPGTPEPGSCPGRQQVNWPTCDCRCPAELLQECTPAQVYDTVNCNCTCPPEAPTSCEPPQIFVFETCSCECPDVNGVPYYEPLECPAPHIFNKTICGCNCPPGSPVASDCVRPQLYNEAKCMCECPEALLDNCTAPYVYWEQYCSCRCPPGSQKPGDCEPPKVFDVDTCTCNCPEVECPEGKIQSMLSCQCRCDPDVYDDCEFPQRMDPNTCECVCPPAECTPVQKFNETTCNCDCPPDTPTNCTAPQEVDYHICACACPPKLKIVPHPKNTVWNDTTCEWECPRDFMLENCTGAVNWTLCECIIMDVDVPQSNSRMGVIVGASVAGAAALGAFAALALFIARRKGTAPSAPVLQDNLTDTLLGDNPLYAAASGGTNPLYAAT